MRLCPFHGCRVRLTDDKFACASHWFTLTQLERLLVYDLFNRYQTGEITIGDLRAGQQSVLRERGDAYKVGTVADDSKRSTN